MLARISGLVTMVTERRGTSGQGNAYAFTTAHVFVAGLGVTEVTWNTGEPLSGSGRVPHVLRGELVDWLVDVGTYRSEPSARLLNDEWPDDSALFDLIAASGAPVGK